MRIKHPKSTSLVILVKYLNNTYYSNITTACTIHYGSCHKLKS